MQNEAKREKNEETSKSGRLVQAKTNGEVLERSTTVTYIPYALLHPTPYTLQK